MVIAAASVAACTVVVAVLTPTVPVRSAGVFYLVAVLAVSSLYGLWLGLATSLVSALAFNFFFLPPLHTFTISSSGDWLALAAFALAAVVTSQLAARERAEAEQATRRAARALGARDGGIHLGPPAPSARAGRAVPIELDGRRLGELRLIDAPAGVADSADAARIGRILAGLIALGQEREQRLANEVESEALRRSN